MPSTLFDSAGLAVVAYAQVDGATGASGSSQLANSGVFTTRISQGVYNVNLSTAIEQDPSRDLIFVQPKATTAIPAAGARSAVITESGNDITKIVEIFGTDVLGGTTTALDSDFNILILRTILP